MNKKDCDYTNFVLNLRKTADQFEKEHPELPGVVATYRECADIIETILHEHTQERKEHILKRVEQAELMQRLIDFFERKR